MGGLHDWKHCPRCGAPLENDGSRASCAQCGFVAYAHSDATVSAFVLDGDRVLLARRAAEPARGKWDLPGGFLEEGEHPLDALRRELREETAMEIEPLEFAGVWMDRYGDGDDAPATLNLYWTARVVSGEPTPSDDVAELRWFPLDELPPVSELGFHNVAQALRSLRQ